MIEYSLRIKKILFEGYKSISIIDPRATITSDGSINNHQNNKNKIVIGRGTIISGNIIVFKHGGEVIIGEDCFLGTDSKIWSAKKIIIGNRVLISHNVNIHDNNSHPLDAKLRHEDFIHIFSIGLQKNMDLREADIIIEDDVWIGFNSIIMKGVKIGKCAVVGAGTIVTHDIPEYALVVGNPARIIKYLQ